MSDREIRLGVFGLGITPRHRGFWLICEVLGLMAERGGGVFRPEEIYPRLGICGETSRRSAERCMRYAIQYAWDTPGSGLRGLFRSPPPLADFFCAAAWLVFDAESADAARIRPGSSA